MIATAGTDSSTLSTNIIHNGTLATAVSGLAAGWLDNGRVLVNTYLTTPYPHGVLIYSPTGVALGASPLPVLRSFQPLSSDTIYSPELNSILSVSTGAVIWPISGPIPSMGVGAVAGANVVFAYGPRVLFIPY